MVASYTRVSFFTFRYRKQKPMKSSEMFCLLIWVISLFKPLDIEVLLQGHTLMMKQISSGI